MRIIRVQMIPWCIVVVIIGTLTTRSIDCFVLDHHRPSSTSSSRRLATPQSNDFGGFRFQSHQSRNVKSRKNKRPWVDDRRNNKENSLIPVLDSILYYGQHVGQSSSSSSHEMASTELIEALKQLKQVARNPAQIQQIGQLLLKPQLLTQQPFPIQERLLKALALAGLLEQATVLLQNMVQQQHYLPSYISYTAILSALRREGRTEEMYHWLLELTRLAQQQQEKKSIHVMAMNLYLAALCDQGTKESIDQAAQWILRPENTDKIFGVPLDLTSYNTVLHGAAKMGNETLVEAIWQELTKSSASSSSSSTSLQPDIRSYNARLIASNSYARRLELNDELVQVNVVPDRYTLDLLLLPMVVLEKQETWEQMLDLFMARQSHGIIRDAFSAYLNTLVQNGKLNYAQQLFDTYIASQWDDRPNGDTGLACLADSRHFNVLIDGYRRQAENAAIAAASKVVSMDFGDDNQDNAAKAVLEAEHFAQEEQLARAQGRTLFRNMKRASILPDVYTITSMMGLCECPAEVVDLLMNPKWQNRITPPVIRSAITASGQLGDAGLACALFDRYAPMDKFVETSPRLWNVLLGALADCAQKSNGVIELDSSATVELLQYSTPDESSNLSISQTLQGKTYPDAVKHLMNHLGEMANSQSYCVAAAALQYDPDSGPDLAMSLFRNATSHGIPADGRFVNAIFRCFGDKIDDALLHWKSELRQACLEHEAALRNERIMPYNDQQSPQKNLVAAYNGLIHVCGRAQRPDIAVRLVYAMNREGIEPNDVTLNNYRAGKRLGKEPTTARRASLLSLPNMVRQYENILYVECTKYNQYNKRMSKDKRLRIIV